MYAPTSWGLARQEQARSPTIRQCKWSFMSGFSWNKSARQPGGGSKQERTETPAASTPFMLNPSRNQSRTDLSANPQPNEGIATAPSINDSSDPNSDHSDHDSTERVIPHSNPQPEQSAASSSTPAITTTPERGQLVSSKPAPRAQIRATAYRKRTPTLPSPTNDPFSVFRETKTLKVDAHDRKYFLISRTETQISNLPRKEQNAAYNHALTNVLPPKTTPKRARAHLQNDCAEKILEHYRLHLSRLLFTRCAIRELTLQHRTSARLANRCAMSSWGIAVLQDPYSKPYLTAEFSFMRRAGRECEERGILALLDRCERFLRELDPRFKAVGWQPVTKKKTRWKEGRRGWIGLDFDDEELLQGDRQGREGNDEGGAVMDKKALKEALQRAAKKAMGKKREVGSVFARGKGWDRK